jgi:hypothetical protein
VGADTTTIAEPGVESVDSRALVFRCFLLSLSVVVLAVLAYLAMVTLVNPRQQLPSPFHIFPADTLNSRAIKSGLLQKYHAEAPVTGIIMGGSTSLKMSPEVVQQITGKRFFNAAVFMATPRDYLAQYRLFKREGVRLSVLIVGIDVSSLRQAPEWNELKASWPMQTALEPGRTGWLFRAMHWIRVYSDTLNVAFAQEVKSSIWAYLHHMPPSMVFVPDGRIDYIAWDRDLAEHPDHRDYAMEACSDLEMSWMYSPVILAATQQGALEELIREARSDDVDVRLWIAPHHPQFYARLVESREAAGNLSRVRAYLTSLHDRFGIPVFDLSDESTFGGDPVDWYDCSHFRDDNARLVVDEVMSSPSDSNVPAETKEEARSR